MCITEIIRRIAGMADDYAPSSYKVIFKCKETEFMGEPIIDMLPIARIDMSTGAAELWDEDWWEWDKLDAVERDILLKKTKEFQGRLVICDLEKIVEKYGKMPSVRFKYEQEAQR